MSYLILVRHGETRWNQKNRFTGWVDVPLSEKGITEAKKASEKLKDIKLDVAFTSKLARAQETMLILLSQQNYTGITIHTSKKRNMWSMHPGRYAKDEIPIYSSDKLNDRHYGELQGLDKEATKNKFGEKKVFLMRRSWKIAPPKGESLQALYKRVVPYFQKEVIPHLKKRKNVIIVSHGNTLRSIMKYIDNISDDDISHLELPWADPVIYKFQRNMLRLTKKHSFIRPVKWKK